MTTNNIPRTIAKTKGTLSSHDSKLSGLGWFAKDTFYSQAVEGNPNVIPTWFYLSYYFGVCYRLKILQWWWPLENQLSNTGYFAQRHLTEPSTVPNPAPLHIPPVTLSTFDSLKVVCPLPWSQKESISKLLGKVAYVCFVSCTLTWFMVTTINAQSWLWNEHREKQKGLLLKWLNNFILMLYICE